MRLQKYLAEAGVVSRRGAEALIQSGHISVNGRLITTLGTRVNPSSDSVRVDGRPVQIQAKVHLALHKPAGVVCTRRDEHGRPTVLDLLPKHWAKDLYPVGRLDRDTEGLLLLTNDGEFCLRITHPRYGVPKVYLATVQGRAPDSFPASAVRGRMCDGERLRARRAMIVSAHASRSVLELELTEGKNREVRRLLRSLGLKVQRLQRMSIGSVRLHNLPRGKWRRLTSAEIRGLLSDCRQTGPPAR